MFLFTIKFTHFVHMDITSTFSNRRSANDNILPSTVVKGNIVIPILQPSSLHFLWIIKSSCPEMFHSLEVYLKFYKLQTSTFLFKNMSSHDGSHSIYQFREWLSCYLVVTNMATKVHGSTR